MAGPTDVLTEDVKDLRESNRQLASEIKVVFERMSVDTRESNQRLTDAINGVARDLSVFRVEVAKDLGTINVNLTDAINGVARDLANFRVEVAKELGVINANLERFQSRTEAYLSVAKWAVGVVTVIVLGLVGWSYSAYARAVHIEESIVALRDTAKNQESSIANLRELHDIKRTTPNDSPHPSDVGPAPRKP
jgi:glycerate-2-kinase